MAQICTNEKTKLFSYIQHYLVFNIIIFMNGTVLILLFYNELNNRISYQIIFYD